jgi:hypothetical protein
MSEALSWTELVVLMVDVPEPEPTVRGAIRSLHGDDDSSRSFGFFRVGGDPMPVHAAFAAAHEDAYRVWRDGFRVRMEWPDGSPSLIVGDTLCWRFPAPGSGGDVVASPVSVVRYGGHGTDLLWHDSGERLLGKYSRRPLSSVEPTELLGRPAWTVRVGPPSDKQFTSLWVVDAETGVLVNLFDDETGLLLRDYNEVMHSVDEWVELVVGEPIDPALFTWDGPFVDEAVAEGSREAEHEQDMESRRQWFTANVAPLPLRLEVLTSVLVNLFDDETGAFQASIGNGSGSLARRPHSDEPWRLGWSQPGHRWVDGPWDWAFHSWDLEMTAEGLESLKRQLSP